MGCLLYKEAKLEESKLWECFYNTISCNLGIKCILKEPKWYISLGWGGKKKKKKNHKENYSGHGQNYVILFWRQIKCIFLALKIPERALVFLNS